MSDRKQSGTSEGKPLEPTPAAVRRKEAIAAAKGLAGAAAKVARGDVLEVVSDREKVAQLVRDVAALREALESLKRKLRQKLRIPLDA